MPNESPFNRITLIVLDGAGIGAMPDAPEWGDAESDTFGHICESRQLQLPNLRSLGLGNIRPLAGVPKIETPRGSYGKCALRSNGKDTTTGHWEMAGIILERAFPTYPNGFPQSVIDEFIAKTGVPGILGNIPASGTEIMKQLGEEHVKTKKPIVYTSADSVFQVAAHEEIIPLDELYRICEIARKLCDEIPVARVIARPRGLALKLPKGFWAIIAADGFERPRFMIAVPNRQVLVSDSGNANPNSGSPTHEAT